MHDKNAPDSSPLENSHAAPFKNEPPRRLISKRLQSIIGPLLSVTVLLVALVFLHRELGSLSPDAIFGQLRSINYGTLLLAMLCAIGSYTALTFYDVLALGYVGAKLGYAKTAVTSFIANAVGHNVGLAALSGGSIRYRMYSSFGLSASSIARVIAFVSITFFLGVALVLGTALLLMPLAQWQELKWSPLGFRALGGLLVLLPLSYLLFTVLRGRAIELGNWKLHLPKPRIALSQLAISSIDLMFAAATLYVLLADHLSIGFWPFLGIYLLAVAAAVASSVPGGIGVFEAVLLASLPELDRGVLLATIIVYRSIYFLLPLVLAMTILGGYEMRHHKPLLQRGANLGKEWLSALAPHLVGLLVFIAGTVLLVSGATPVVAERLAFLNRVLPLYVLEFSHLTGSILGVGLLILARGLYRRLHNAYIAAIVLLLAGMAVSLLKGLEYETALLFALTLGILVLSRGEFYRSKALLAQRFSPVWVAAIVIVLCAVAWVGLISFRHVQYSDALWWQFALNQEAPRMLRASLVAAITALSFGLVLFFRGSAKEQAMPGEQDIEKIKQVISVAKNSSANLALLGDKQLLWSANNDAFIMYGISGRSWIAMGDPVGPEHAHEELVWSFRELVDQYAGRPVFYQVSDDSLALYVDMGLSLSKLGEDASIALNDFSLEGSARAEFRQAVRKAEKAGASFEVVPCASIPAISAELAAVSAAWLAAKNTSEKGFSLGAFSESYIAYFDCAVVRIDNTIVAFANLWPAAVGGELSIDLMRFSEQAPKGIMDYLFAELMLWGRAQGYQRFSLGMAPLAGLEQHALAPLWHKLGHLIFEHGENFYNFEGLRNYKNKFDPEWRPRYLACPGGVVNLPSALIDTSRLISGGWRGLVGK